MLEAADAAELLGGRGCLFFCACVAGSFGRQRDSCKRRSGGMNEMLEIRWHGRGGQGVKTAALLLAESVATAGRYVQAFPEYGPERMGAPVLAFNRISSSPIALRCHVNEPGVVVVLDSSLIGKVDVAGGLPENGAILVNTGRSPAEMRGRLGIQGRRIFTVDATQIAAETLGMPIPNTPMIGALLRVSGLIAFKEFLNSVRVQLEHKFKTKPSVIEGNMRAIERAYAEVKTE